MKTEEIENAVNHAELFMPIKLGSIDLGHRVVMAPLTRLRSEADDIPGSLMVEYYRQRASAGGLIISEATEMTPYGSTYPGAPGIFNREQTEGWKKVTEAVHEKGGFIYLQLFHGGRTAHSENIPGNVLPVAPSAIRANGVAFTPTGIKPLETPRALDIDEITELVADFRKAAEYALQAGFDGLEIQCAGGYLLDEFLQDSTNHRTDQYGGSVENRARLLFEVLDAVIPVYGNDRISVRLTPDGKFNDMSDSDPEKTFGYVTEQLNKYNLAFLHLVEPRIKGGEEVADNLEPIAAATLRKIYKGTIIATGGFQPESAAEIIGKGDADLVAFGRHFIANPDFPERIRKGLSLNPYDRDTFYGGGEKGYTDYPFHSSAN